VAIKLHRIQHVFEPQIKARAKNNPWILINDGYSTHESLEITKLCYETISFFADCCHISHKLQPYDVGIFGLLKTAYRGEVERLFRQGSNMIKKQYLTLWYLSVYGVMHLAFEILYLAGLSLGCDHLIRKGY
jgi:hypothetical protein